MNVFVAGATGDLGKPLVRTLIEAGHEVTGMTHRPERRGLVSSLGAQPAVAHALDAEAVGRVVAAARPQAVVDVMTALPRRGPMRFRDLEPTNQIRTRGSAILIEAARAAGAQRIVSESIVFAYGWGNVARPLTEEDRVYPETVSALRPAMDALRAKEEGTLRAAGMEGIVLRFGGFYGPEVGTTETLIRLARRKMLALPAGGHGLISWIHIQDAAAATVGAVERGECGEAYNVVDDEPATYRAFAEELTRVMELPRPYGVPVWLARWAAPYAALVLAQARVPASNRKAKDDLGWAPVFRTYREGLVDVADQLTARTFGRSVPS